MPTYTYVTLTQAEIDLANRLMDPGMVQWTAAELQVYLVEALRTWNALTNFSRADMPTISNITGQRWYDLTTIAGGVRPFTVTDQSIHQTIEYHLLEPLVSYPGSWTGSGQFGLADLIGAWNRRQAETVMDTGCTLSVSTVGIPATAPYRTVLSDSVLAIRRVVVAPTPSTGVPQMILEQGDIWEKLSYNPTYAQTSAWPTTWRQSTDPPNAFDTDPLPVSSGNFEILTVLAPTPSTGSSPVTLSVPDDWSWVVKWGTLIDLMGGEGERRDPRAEYCVKRYKEGLAIMRGNSAVLGVFNASTQVQFSPDAVQNADRWNPGWVALPVGPPMDMYLAGMNLFALSPTGVSFSLFLTITVVQNMPIPANGGDYLQIPRNDYDALLDYAQHLAMFKQGGQEFTATFVQLSNFFKRATLYNARLAGMGTYQPPIYTLSGLDEKINPTYQGAEQEDK